MYEYAISKGGHLMNLHGRDFLKLIDYTPEEIKYLIDVAIDLKKKKHAGIPHDELRGKILFYYLKKTQQELAVLLK